MAVVNINQNFMHTQTSLFVQSIPLSAKKKHDTINQKGLKTRKLYIEQREG